jgi:hypothetical protein
MRHLLTRFSFLGGAMALLLLAAGCTTTSQTQTLSVPDMLIASGFQERTPSTMQRAKLQSLTSDQISQINAYGLTLYVYPEWAKNRVLVGGPAQYSAYQQYRTSHKLPAENAPQVYRGPAASFDWRKWYQGA